MLRRLIFAISPIINRTNLNPWATATTANWRQDASRSSNADGFFVSFVDFNPRQQAECLRWSLAVGSPDFYLELVDHLSKNNPGKLEQIELPGSTFGGLFRNILKHCDNGWGPGRRARRLTENETAALRDAFGRMSPDAQREALRSARTGVNAKIDGVIKLTSELNQQTQDRTVKDKRRPVDILQLLTESPEDAFIHMPVADDGELLEEKK